MAGKGLPSARPAEMWVSLQKLFSAKTEEGESLEWQWDGGSWHWPPWIGTQKLLAAKPATSPLSQVCYRAKRKPWAMEFMTLAPWSVHTHEYPREPWLGHLSIRLPMALAFLNISWSMNVN